MTGGPELVLASQSPGRAAILRSAGVRFRQLVSDVDEDAVVAAAGPLSPAETALLLARAKAEAVAALPEVRGALVLGCDSVFELDGEAHGKPWTVERAVERLTAQSGRTGVLHSGHWLVDARGDAEVLGSALPSRGETVSTAVSFVEMSPEEIRAYAQSGEPLQCAGSFTIDGLGAAFISRIDGDPAAVVGLSVRLLRDLLAHRGVPIPQLWTAGAER